jgi:hypothetical protein
MSNCRTKSSDHALAPDSTHVRLNKIVNQYRVPFLMHFYIDHCALVMA